MSSPAPLSEQLLETWQIHNRIHLYLLEALPPESLGAQLSSGGRNVGRQFAHVHDVRLMWLKAAAPDLLEGLARFGAEQAPDKAALVSSLQASGDAMYALIGRGLKTGRIKSFKPHPGAFVGYVIAHESSHRGEICVALTQAGQRLPDKVAYGLWEWGSR